MPSNERSSSKPDLTTAAFVSVASAILNGYALSILWGWFIVPKFEAPSLRIPEAIGISMVVAYLTHQNQKDSDETKSFGEKFTYAVCESIAKPAFALLIGWIITFWM